MVKKKKLEEISNKELKAVKNFLIALNVLGIKSEDLQFLVENKNKIIDTINNHTVTLENMEKSLNEERSKNNFHI